MAILPRFSAIKTSRMAASSLFPFSMLQTLQFSLTAKLIMFLLMLIGTMLIKALFKKAAQIRGMSSRRKKLNSGFSRVIGFKNHSERNTISKTSFPKFVKPEEVINSELQRKDSSKAGLLLNATLIQSTIPPPGSSSHLLVHPQELGTEAGNYNPETSHFLPCPRSCKERIWLFSSYRKSELKLGGSTKKKKKWRCVFILF